MAANCIHQSPNDYGIAGPRQISPLVRTVTIVLDLWLVIRLSLPAGELGKSAEIQEGEVTRSLVC